MIGKKTRKIFIRALLVLIIFGGITILLDLLIHYPLFQRYLIRQIADTTQYDIQTGKIRIGFRTGLGIHVSKLTARSRNSALKIIADSVDISFAYRKLLNRQLIPERAYVKNARIIINPQQKTTGPVSTAADQVLVVEQSIGTLFGGFKRVMLKNANLTLLNSDYGIQHLNATIREIGRGRDGRIIDLDGLLDIADITTKFQWKGTLARAPNGGDHFFTQSTLTVTDLPLAHFPWPRHVPFETGRASGELNISGIIGADISVSGRFAADNLRFSVVRGDRTKTYHIPHTDMNIMSRIGLQAIHIEKLTCRLPQTSLSLAMQLDWREPSSPKMDLDIRTSPIPLAAFKHIFPTPLVPEWIKTRLFPLFSGGTARLDRFRLNGTINQINSLNRPGNAKVLELRLALEGLTALAGNTGLPVTQLGGNVAIADGQLLITDVNGHFGRSDLHQVTMTWPDLYGKSDAFQIGIKGDFRLADLKRQSGQPILPGVIRREIDPVSTAQGQLSADIGLFFPAPQQPPILKGVLKVKNGRITHSALPLPLDLADARFIFNGKNPAQLDAAGRWGQSDISISGTFGLPWVAGKKNHIPLNLDIDADADLSDLLTIRQWQALPARFRIFCSDIETVAGHVAARFNVRRAASTIEDTQITGNFSTSHITLAHPDLKLPLDIQDARLELSGSGQGQFTASGRWGQSPFTADGGLVSLGKTMEISIVTQADANEILKSSFAGKPSAMAFNIPLPGRLQIRKNDARWIFNGEIGLDDVEIRLPSLTLSPPGKDNRLTFTAEYGSASGITLDHVRFFKNKSRLDVKTTRSALPDGKLSFEILAERFNLKDLGLQMQGRHADKSRSVSGMVAGRLTGSLPARHTATARLNGHLVVTDLILSEAVDPPRYNADLRFKDKTIEIAALTFPLGGSRAVLQGNLTRGDHIQGHLVLNAGTVDIPHLIRQFGTEASPKSGPSILDRLSASDLDLSITVRKAIWKGIDLGLLQASVRYQDSILRVPKAVFTAPDSFIKLSGTLAGRDRSGISLLTYIKIDEKPLHTLLNGFDIHTDRIDGTTSLEGGLFFGGRTKAEILQNMAGQFNIQITDGEIKNSNVLLKLMDFLSIQNIFVKKPPSVLKERFYFKSIQGHVNVQKGSLKADRLFMKSPVFNAAAKGYLDLPKNHMQVALGVQPLNTIDFFVSKIPILGHILTGKEKTILVYYFKVRGPIENPTLKQVPFNNLGKALAGYFKRLFLTPARILFKISDTLGDIGKGIQSDARPPKITNER